MNINNNSILNREFVLITTIGFFYFFNLHSFLLLPPFLTDLGATEKDVGFIMGISGVSTLILTPLVGYLSDKIGKKLFISSGFLLLILSTFPFAYISNIGFYVYLLRILHGASFSLFFISAGAYTTDISPETKKTQAIGIYGVFTVINYAIAPFVGSIIINRFDFKTYILLLSVFGIIGFVLSLALKNISKSEKEGLFKVPKSYLSYIKNKPSLISAFALFILGAAFISVLNFISLFSLSISIESYYLYFVSYTAAVLLIRLFFGWVPDKYGRWKVSSPSILVFAFAILILAFTKNLTILIVAAFIFGVAHGFAYPSIYTIIIESAGSISRSKSFAVSSLSFTAGGMIGSILYGMVADFFGFRVMFSVIASTVFITFFIFNSYSKKFELMESKFE